MLSRGDAQICFGHQGGGVLQIALCLDRAGDHAAIAQWLPYEGTCQLLDIEVVQIARDVELFHLLNGRRAGEATAEGVQAEAVESDAMRIGGNARVEADAGEMRRALLERDVPRVDVGGKSVIVIRPESGVASDPGGAFRALFHAQQTANLAERE